MKRITSLLLILMLIMGTSLSGFSVAAGSSIQSAVGIRQEVVIKGLKAKEGKWDKVTFKMEELVPLSSIQSKIKKIRVKMTMETEGFKGSQSGILKTNFPVKVIGDSKLKVSFENVSEKLFSEVGFDTPNDKKAGAFSSMKADALKDVMRYDGEFDLLIPLNDKTVTLPIILSDNKCLYFKLIIPKEGFSPQYLLKGQKTYGHEQIGKITTALSFEESPYQPASLSGDEGESNDEDNETGIQLKLNNGDYNSSTTAFVKIYYDVYKGSFNEDVLAQRLNDDSDFTRITKDSYKSERITEDGNYNCTVYYLRDEYYRYISFDGSKELESYGKALIGSYKFDDAKLTLPPLIDEAKQSGGYYNFSYPSAKFKSEVPFFNFTRGSALTGGVSIFLTDDLKWSISYIKKGSESKSIKETATTYKENLEKEVGLLKKENIQLREYENGKLLILSYGMKRGNITTYGSILFYASEDVSCNIVRTDRRSDAYAKEETALLKSLIENAGFQTKTIDEYVKDRGEN